MADSPRSPFDQIRSIRLRLVKPRWLMLALAAGVAAMGVGTWAQHAGQTDSPPNFDIRTDRALNTSGYVSRFQPPQSIADLPARRAGALAQLKRSVPDLEVEVSPALGTPELVGVRAGFGFLTGASADRVGTLRAFLTAYGDVYGLSQAQAASLEVIADYVNPAGNMAWVELQQRFNGIPVFQGLIRGAFTAQGELGRTTGVLAAGVQPGMLSAAPGMGAGEALARAAATVPGRLPASAFRARGTDAIGRATFGDTHDIARAWLVYFPLMPGVARLAWATEVMSEPDAFLILVDAEDGTLLYRKNLTEYQTQAATYSVYNDDSPAPMSPTTALPGSGLQAPMILRTLFTLIGNEGVNAFNNLGWMTDGLNETAGNNVQAGLDLAPPEGIEATVPGVARVFNFPYNPGPGNPPPGDSPAGASYRNGEVTDMFFWTNVYHDRLYLLGFNELARNFQNDNFGRGGAQNDRVLAEGQDSSGTDNANFSTPTDGGSGRMQMYIFTGPTPDRTSALDHDVLLHELTHGTSNRLHNNATGLTATMSRGMGEGWSDFYGRSILSSADEDPDGIYSTGGWVTYHLGGPTYTDNYYYGIRRFPYAVRSKVGANGLPHNPLTFADLDPTQVNLNDGAFPRGPFGSGLAFQVHNIGEIWASALFEVRALFIKRLGHALGNQRILQFVTDGMKLDPVNPTLLQGRDSILAAASLAGNAADIEDIWTGFAIRGMGYSAQVLNATTGSVIEAFDVPGIKDSPPMSLVGESIPNGAFDSGETVTVSLCITNTALSPSGSVLGTVLATGGVASPSPAQSFGAVAPAGNVCRNYTFIVAAGCGQGLTVTLQAQETGGLTRHLQYTAGVGTLAPSMVESFDGVAAPVLPAGWSTSLIGGAANPWVTSVVAPHTPPNRVFAANPATTSDNALLSAVIAMPATPSVLVFRNNYNTEAGGPGDPNFYDGGVLEISINGGAFTDIVTAGGVFSIGGYNATIFALDTNPLAGRQAWAGNSGGYIQTQLLMPPAAAGQNVVLRWRLGTDSIVGATGWAIDTLGLFGITCASQPPIITTQPQSQVVMSGNAATLTVVAGGSGVLTYQWYAGLSGDLSSPIGGATSASYTTPALVAAANYWVRVTNGAGNTNSTTAAITIGPGLGAELVQNGNFNGGLANWAVFEEPNIQWNITAGVFQYWRQNPGVGSTQAVVFQQTGQPVAARTALQASFRVGNSSSARKRISVLIIDSDFSDITVCTFWLAPGSPMSLYTMNTHTTKAWTNAAIYFYAATKGQDGGFYQLDDVSLSHQPALPTNRTDCIDPFAPAPTGGPAGPELIANGHFQVGGLSSWASFGSLTWQVEGGVLEFFRPAPLPTPAGVVFQQTGVPMVTGDIYTATFQFGNSSGVWKRVTVLIQEADFSDLIACTFWLSPGQPLRDYTMQGFTTKAWTNATLAIYGGTVGTNTWTRVDNVTFKRTPAASVFGTTCIEPVVAPFAEGDAGRTGGTSAAPETVRDGGVTGGDGTDPPLRATVQDAGIEAIYWDRPIDLTNASSAELSFDSSLAAASSSGHVQVSRDGMTWRTVTEVPAIEDRVSVDLSPFAGEVVYVRFVLAPRTLLRSRPDSWTIDNLALRVR